MIKNIQDAVLGSPLDCQNFSIFNLARLLPVPASLVDVNDSRLSDQRPIIDGTVTDDSVAATASIDQGKLDFNDDMPTPWIGTGANQAAPGDLVERVAHKGVPGGYVALDTGGLLPAANITAGVGPGTVNSVTLKLPSEFSASTDLDIIDFYSESNQNAVGVLANDVLPAGPAGGFGQCFTGNGETIMQARWYLRKFVSPTGNAVAKIWTMTGTFGVNGNTGTLLATSSNFNVSTLTTSLALIAFFFPGGCPTVNGTHYVVTIEYTNGDAGNYVELGYDSSGTHPGNFVFHSQATGGAWTAGAAGISLCFYVDGVPADLPDTLPVITTSGTFFAVWGNTPAESWFGVDGPIGLSPVLLPSFIANKIPIGLVPDFDAARFTTGEFAVARLPVAVGLGVDHSIGVVPDPGLNGDPKDYLGRDMAWHPFVQNLPYQPTVQNVLITLTFSPDTNVYVVTIRSLLSGSVLFYRVNGGSFIEVHSGGAAGNSIALNLALNDFVEAYASRAGYNNSAIAAYTVTPPAPT